MDKLLLIWLLLFLIGVKPVSHLALDINSEYISKENGTCYRGAFAVAIVLHHIAQQTTWGLHFNSFFNDIGPLAVAVFFFISGYGLQRSYMNSANYKTTFLARRIPTILFPYLIMLLIQWAFSAACGKLYSPQDIIVHFIDGDPIVAFSWYIIAILYFYLAFYVSMVLCRQNHLGMVACMCGSYILYFVLCRVMDYGDWWYLTAPVLMIGMLWAIYERRIVEFFSRNSLGYWIVFITSLTITILLFKKFDYLLEAINYSDGYIVILMIRNAAFVIQFILLTMKLRIGNKALKYLGEISLEIYLVQGLFINGPKLGLTNQLLWSIYILTATIIAASLFHKLTHPRCLA